MKAKDAEIERLRDLVRYKRAELHDDGLITDQEYGDLAKVGSESARRLEGYDDLRATIKSLTAELEEVRARLAIIEPALKYVAEADWNVSLGESHRILGNVVMKAKGAINEGADA